MKYAQNLNGERSCKFIAPIGMITKSFLDDDKYEREYKAVFDEKNGAQHLQMSRQALET